jgi:hypothetical protein
MSIEVQPSLTNLVQEKGRCNILTHPSTEAVPFKLKGSREKQQLTLEYILQMHFTT